MATAVLPFAELHAPPDWRTVDFISDLHLHESEPATFTAWQEYLESTPADAVFVLGDLFEVWVGDDAADADTFAGLCAQTLKAAAKRRKIFFMHGNRDFLVGRGFLASLGVTLLDDPTVFVSAGMSSFLPLWERAGAGADAGQRWLLTHGDSLCLDDVDYLAFRAQVRSAEWQAAFLAKPLATRRDIARGLREQSEARKRTGVSYADVDSSAARDWLQHAQAATLIHGHTHKPADHDLGAGLRRIVLSDWDAAATPPRAQVLRLTAGGLQRLALA
ncbi:MAG: UDP-2,3-diacylglucosamine diphosphatase [Bdellovibrionales bacterium]|nr:UDP-2,3-diacylglucosamine diphosphatase [Ramlibacter sp.]